MKCERPDLTLQTMSDSAIYLTADIIGEADPLSSHSPPRDEWQLTNASPNVR
jgi:hypothetical protein